MEEGTDAYQAMQSQIEVMEQTGAPLQTRIAACAQVCARSVILLRDKAVAWGTTRSVMRR
eukprot:6304181-Amphidinium_carterae.3